MITRSEILKDAKLVLSTELEANLIVLLKALNQIRAVYNKPMRVVSGYRSPAHNLAVHGARNSLHMVCLACDFQDADDQLSQWCLSNLSELEKAGLYLEDPAHTPGWVHLQAKAPRSGNRVFKP